MKKQKKLWGILVLALIFGFVMAGCDSGGGGGGLSGKDSIVLRGNVVVPDYDDEDEDEIVGTKKYDGDTLVFASNGDAGVIDKGKLDITIETEPLDKTDLPYLKRRLEEMWGTVTLLPSSGVNAHSLELDPGYGLKLSQGSIKLSTSKGEVTGATIQQVYYVYVDDNIRMSANKFSPEEGFTANSFNISLKEGWNALSLTLSGNEKSGLSVTLGSGAKGDWLLAPFQWDDIFNMFFGDDD